MRQVTYVESICHSVDSAKLFATSNNQEMYHTYCPSLRDLGSPCSIDREAALVLKKPSKKGAMAIE
jgi:hypothetical protein